MRSLVCLFPVLIFTLFVGQSLGLAQDQQGDERGAQGGKKNPFAGKPDAIAAGQKRFQEGCATCHGAHGEGGRGPNLLRNPELRSSSDEQVFNVIRNGIRGSQMPPNPMPDPATWQLVAFVRNLSAPAFTMAVPGNVDEGRGVFLHAGCSGCHMVRGEGGYLGPDLTDVGASRTVGQIEASLLHPEGRLREQGFVGAQAVTKNGNRVEGVAKNNTNYSIQVLDRAGRLHLLNKADLQSITFDPEPLAAQHHPAGMTNEDMQNLVAFLSKQAVRPDATTHTRRHREEDF